MQYLIKKRETCPDCGGTKIVSNPIYEDFAKANKQYLNDNPPNIDDDTGYQDWNEKKYQWECEWFAKQGYPGGVKNWPIEEYSCEECDVTGFVETWVDLSEALKALKEQP